MFRVKKFLEKKKLALINLRKELLCQSNFNNESDSFLRSSNLQIKLSVIDEELALIENQIARVELDKLKTNLNWYEEARLSAEIIH